MAEFWTFWPSWTWTNVSKAVPLEYKLLNEGKFGKTSDPVNKK